MKRLALVMMVWMMVLVVTACGSGEGTGGSAETASGTTGESVAAGDAVEESVQETELTIAHQLGETTVPKNPEKVVVFDFGILDSLDKMGVPVTGVPQANIPPYLAKYEGDEYENVGSLKEPDFEKMSEIDPDLIIISGRQAEAYEELSKLGPTIFLGVDTTNYMASFKENMLTLGKIFDQESFVEEELHNIEAAVKELHEQASSSGQTALVILANDGNISAFGPGSRFGFVYDDFGFEAVDENIEASTHGMNVSFEYIAEQDPDYLFVIDRGAVLGGETSAQQMLDNELVANTKAYQQDQIVYLDANYWYLSGGGLVSVAEMIKQVKEAIN
ncbi:siderophore ABC transporter substrate-binding protein [Caldalkalibacillus uzonensis]|nr:siderophore ABC transporter substrate-binding protein [Caldalkalibacillus uzonensis]